MNLFKITKKVGLVSVVTMIGLMQIQITEAAMIDISVQQDVSILEGNPDSNYWQDIHQYLWVGGTTPNLYKSVFGFDVSSLTSLVGAGQSLSINSVSFNAYHNYNNVDGLDYLHLGTDDNWSSNTATYNNMNSTIGTNFSSQVASQANLNQWLSWDASSISADELNDDYLTFFLVGAAGTWNDYENSDWTGNNHAYLSFDYDITNSAVPEPSIIALFAAGLFGIGLVRRRRSQS